MCVCVCVCVCVGWRGCCRCRGKFAAASGDLEADCVGWPLGVRPAVQFANKSVRLAAEVRPLSPNRPSECRGEEEEEEEEEGSRPCHTQTV